MPEPRVQSDRWEPAVAELPVHALERGAKPVHVVRCHHDAGARLADEAGGGAVRRNGGVSLEFRSGDSMRDFVGSSYTLIQGRGQR